MLRIVAKVTPHHALDSKSGRPGNQSNLSTSQNPVFDEGTTPHTNPTAQININIQLSDVVIDACKTHSGVSPKPDLSPTGQRGQVPQAPPHEPPPETVQMLLQIPGFQNAVAVRLFDLSKYDGGLYDFSRMLSASLLRKDKFQHRRLHHPFLATLTPLARTSADSASSWLHSSS